MSEERTDETRALGRRIREARIRQGYSRRDFAGLMGWKPKQISRYEMGFPISEHRVAQVARKLDLPFEDLLYGPVPF
jgi:transcriptional regulator with XRE-family HTH domain